MEGLRTSTAELGPTLFAQLEKWGLGRQGRASSRDEQQGKCPDACQHRRAMEMRCQIMKVWKTRTRMSREWE
jgi:hypothetical protein